MFSGVLIKSGVLIAQIRYNRFSSRQKKLSALQEGESNFGVVYIIFAPSYTPDLVVAEKILGFAHKMENQLSWESTSFSNAKF